VSPGEVISFSIDFGPQMALGDTLTGASGALSVYSGIDGNAASLMAGSPVIKGTIVSQLIGAAGGGFQPSVIYRWTVTATTSEGMTLVNYGHIPCQAIN